jgi:hypothetical protein
MRKSITLAALLISACSSQEPRGRGEDLKTFDVQEQAADSAGAPGVNVTAAPGVAFNYRYAFQLPSGRVAAAQEAHAAACEKLGIQRCRITGMRYRLVGQKDIEAMLALRLDPTVARAFGKQATDVVAQAEGLLIDQEISGEDVGTRIKSNARGISQLRSELEKIESQLATLRTTDPHRGELVARADELRREIASLDQSRGTDEEALAGTPMIFQYGSGDVLPELDTRSPIRNALHTAAGSFTTMISFVLLLLALALPWVALAAFGWRIVTLLRRRFGWFGTSGESAAAEASNAA